MMTSMIKYVILLFTVLSVCSASILIKKPVMDTTSSKYIGALTISATEVGNTRSVIFTFKPIRSQAALPVDRIYGHSSLLAEIKGVPIPMELISWSNYHSLSHVGAKLKRTVYFKDFKIRNVKMKALEPRPIYIGRVLGLQTKFAKFCTDLADIAFMDVDEYLKLFAANKDLFYNAVEFITIEEPVEVKSNIWSDLLLKLQPCDPGNDSTPKSNTWRDRFKWQSGDPGNDSTLWPTEWSAWVPTCVNLTSEEEKFNMVKDLSQDSCVSAYGDFQAVVQKVNVDTHPGFILYSGKGLVTKHTGVFNRAYYIYNLKDIAAKPIPTTDTDYEDIGTYTYHGSEYTVRYLKAKGDPVPSPELLMELVHLLDRYHAQHRFTKKGRFGGHTGPEIPSNQDVYDNPLYYWSSLLRSYSLLEKEMEILIYKSK